jgi:hypothetical protein
MIGGEATDHSGGFSFGEDDREALRFFGPHQIERAVEVSLKNVTVKEDEGVEGLVLSGGGDVVVDGQVGEEGGDFGRAHVFGVAFVMEEDEAFDPVHVGFFGADGIVLETNGLAKLVEEFRRGIRRGIW